MELRFPPAISAAVDRAATRAAEGSQPIQASLTVATERGQGHDAERAVFQVRAAQGDTRLCVVAGGRVTR
jgi:hypothetical protein